MNIKIYYFSSTGNTKYGLTLLQYYLVSKGHDCELISVENEDAIRYDCDLLGFASPVYGGYPVKIMMDFIERSETFVYKVPVFTVLCPCSTMGFWGSREIFIDVLRSKYAGNRDLVFNQVIRLSLAQLNGQNPLNPSLTVSEAKRFDAAQQGIFPKSDFCLPGLFDGKKKNRDTAKQKDGFQILSDPER